MWVIIIGRKILYLVLTIKAFKMKKILMSLAVAFVSLAANAQVYVGGNVGIASSKERKVMLMLLQLTRFSLRLVTISMRTGLLVQQ